MKTKFLTTSSAFTILFTLMFTLSIKAQTTSRKDTSADRLASDLSVSKVRARQIKSALNYKQDAVIKAMKDSTLKPAEKRERFKRLMMERNHKIDSIMTPGEKEKLKQYNSAALQQRIADRQSRVKARQEAELNKVPHSASTKGPKTDSVKRPVKTN